MRFETTPFSFQFRIREHPRILSQVFVKAEFAYGICIWRHPHSKQGFLCVDGDGGFDAALDQLGQLGGLHALEFLRHHRGQLVQLGLDGLAALLIKDLVAIDEGQGQHRALGLYGGTEGAGVEFPHLVAGLAAGALREDHVGSPLL